KGKESSVRPVAPGKKVRNRRKTVEKHTKQDENRRNLALFQPLRRHSAGAIKSAVSYPQFPHPGPPRSKGDQRTQRGRGGAGENLHLSPGPSKHARPGLKAVDFGIDPSPRDVATFFPCWASRRQCSTSRPNNTSHRIRSCGWRGQA